MGETRPSMTPTFPRAYEASILNPLHYKFLATPLSHTPLFRVPLRRTLSDFLHYLF